MSNSQHTPGPWFIMGETGPQQEFLISGHPFFEGHPDPLFHATATGATHEEREANARLIAASPELLNAVRFLLSNRDNKISRADVSAANAVIAKATGEQS